MRPLFFDFIRKLKEKFFTFVIPFEKGLKNDIPLRKIIGKFSGITVGSGSGNAMLFVYKSCYRFV